MHTYDHDNNDVTPFAVTSFRDIKQRFGIRTKNRRGHMYIIGQTGTGKTTLIHNMVVSDIQRGRGVGLVDPHGDLAESVLDFVPANRIHDVVYLNPADLDYPVAFNPLESVEPDRRHLVASGIIGTLKKVWPDFWGPRLEHILRHALLTLLEYRGSTLIDLPRLLTDKDFRDKVVAGLHHPQLQQFWAMEFGKYSTWMRSEVASPILNKMGQFLVSLPLRNIVGQRKNTFDFRDLIDSGKILIVNLAKGRVGEDNCSLLGAMIVTKLQLAALSRADIPEPERTPFYLYVDEMHNFVTQAFAEILSEARKYGLNLILAHQYVHQLDEDVRCAVMGNVGTIVSFRIGIEDAQYLARDFKPVFSDLDLVGLPNHHIYLKLLIDGMPSKPFSAFTLPPTPRGVSYKNQVIEASRRSYAKPRAQNKTATPPDPASDGQRSLFDGTQ